MRRMERYILGNARIPISIPPIPTVHDSGVRLTSNVDRHINKRSIPGKGIEYLGGVPLSSPDIFHFAIKKDNPVIHLAIKDQRLDDHLRWVRNGRGLC